MTRITKFAVLLALIWTTVVAGSLAWNLVQTMENSREAARVQAEATFEKDVLFRRWASEKGGVYVPISPDTPPNPYLHFIPERDISTPSGRPLTLMNPAYITRQLYELTAQETGVTEHLTSLNPIRPENAADPWEAAALRRFEQGETVVSSVEPLNGDDFLRFMRPLITEEACLKCHEVQGYRVGDVRGGISVAIPMDPYDASALQQMEGLAAGHLLVWLTGLAGIVMGTRRLRRSEGTRDQAEQRLRGTVRELERSNAELRQFSHVAYHDLQEPLRMVASYVQLLKQRYQGRLDPDADEFIEYASEGAERIQRMLWDLLLYSEVDSPQKPLATVDAGEALDQALVDLQPRIDASGAVVGRGPLPPVTANLGQLVQLWQNLLDNAIKFRGPEPPRIEVKAVPSGGEWLFSLTDNGIGIDPQFAERIFDIFERLHGFHQYPGTGVGLAICRRIVERLGGRIWVESQPGRGATFFFTLPQAKAAGQAAL